MVLKKSVSILFKNEFIMKVLSTLAFSIVSLFAYEVEKEGEYWFIYDNNNVVVFALAANFCSCVSFIILSFRLFHSLPSFCFTAINT